MLFLSSHLAAHHTGVEKRNANYLTVERELRLPVGLEGAASRACAARASANV